MNIVLLQDDFYLNLVDWSGQNILSVGLGTCVYLWSACTSQVQVHSYCSNTVMNSYAVVNQLAVNTKCAIHVKYLVVKKN